MWPKSLSEQGNSDLGTGGTFLLGPGDFGPLYSSSDENFPALVLGFLFPTRPFLAPSGLFPDGVVWKSLLGIFVMRGPPLLAWRRNDLECFHWQTSAREKLYLSMAYLH